MSTKNYTVNITPFAESHYLKKISKKYKKSFNAPWKAVEFMLQRFDKMLESSKAEIITDATKEIIICKVEFKILPNESAKSSGNRCIVAQNIAKNEVVILLVYHKSNVQGSNETQWWKQMIKNNYLEYKDIL
jgi:hypothetical protein